MFFFQQIDESNCSAKLVSLMGRLGQATYFSAAIHLCCGKGLDGLIVNSLMEWKIIRKKRNCLLSTWYLLSRHNPLWLSIST